MREKENLINVVKLRERERERERDKEKERKPNKFHYSPRMGTS